MISFSLGAQFVDSSLQNYDTLLLNSNEGNIPSEVNRYSKITMGIKILENKTFL